MENNKKTQEYTNEEMLELYEQYSPEKQLHRQDVLEGTVVMVYDDSIVVNVNTKTDGIVYKNEVSDDESIDLKSIYKEGDKIDVCVLKTDDGNGNILLSVKKLVANKEFKELKDIYENGTVISVTAKQIVRGGLISYYKNVKGFIPASHIALKFENDLKPYLGKTLEVKLIEYDERKRRAVFSRKEVLTEKLKEKKDEFFSVIHVGDIVEGTVKRVTKFGAFVDLGGFDGLVHLTEISYGRVKEVSDFVKINSKVKVKVLSIDEENEKISLSIKQTEDHPWSKAEEKYKIGSVHTGIVVNTTEFGAFVELESGIEGLVHISQISEERIEKPSDILKEGEKYDFEVLEIDTNERKIKLSRKNVEKKASLTTEELEAINEIDVEEAVVPDESLSCGSCEDPIEE